MIELREQNKKMILQEIYSPVIGIISKKTSHKKLSSIDPDTIVPGYNDLIKELSLMQRNLDHREYKKQENVNKKSEEIEKTEYKDVRINTSSNSIIEDLEENELPVASKEENTEKDNIRNKGDRKYFYIIVGIILLFIASGGLIFHKRRR